MERGLVKEGGSEPLSVVRCHLKLHFGSVLEFSAYCQSVFELSLSFLKILSARAVPGVLKCIMHG